MWVAGVRVWCGCVCVCGWVDFKGTKGKPDPGLGHWRHSEVLGPACFWLKHVYLRLSTCNLHPSPLRTISHFYCIPQPLSLSGLVQFKVSGPTTNGNLQSVPCPLPLFRASTVPPNTFTFPPTLGLQEKSPRCNWASLARHGVQSCARGHVGTVQCRVFALV